MAGAGPPSMPFRALISQSCVARLRPPRRSAAGWYRLRYAGAILALWACFCAPASADPRPADAYIASIPPQVPDPPPLGPGAETVVPNNPNFRLACLELIPALRKNILLGQALTTETRHWGMVLRIDFAMSGTAMQTIAGRVNRLVFWRGEGGTPFVLIAVGQQVPPLPR